MLMLCISACRHDQGLQSSQSSIKVRLVQDPQRINPVFASSNTVSREVYPYIFLQMAEFDPKTLSLSPILAISIPEKKDITEGKYTGGISYTFEILEDAVWTDGTPILATDYLFTLKAINHPTVNATAWKNILKDISDVELYPSNPKKFTVFFSEPYILALEAASSFEFFPEHIYDKNGSLKAFSLPEIKNADNLDRLKESQEFTDFATNFNDVIFQQDNCMGSGPYVLSQWETDQFVRLTRKENYWGNAYPERIFLNSKPKEIIFNIIPDEVTAITQLKAGEIDLMTISNGENFKQLMEEDTDLKFHTPQLTLYYYISMNNSSDKLQDKKVRRALSHLIDVDAFIEQVEYGNAKRTIGTILPFKEEYNSNLKPLEYDEVKAAGLLKEAGWADTNGNGILDKEILGQSEELIFDMFVSGGQVGQRLALLLSESTKKVGAEVNIIQKDGRAILREHIYTGEYDLYPMVIRPKLGEYDPYGSWHSDNAKNGGGNFSRYDNPISDAIMEKLKTETDATKRVALYRDLQEKMYEDQPVVFLYSPVSKIVTSGEIEPLISVKRPGYFLQTATVTRPAFSEN